MKVLIQDRKNRLFWDGENEWVREREKARSFQSAVAAVNHVLARRLTDVNIVLNYVNEHDIAIPLEDPPRKRNRPAP